MGPRYWFRFRDGSWADWQECSHDYYTRVRGRQDCEVTQTLGATVP